MKKSPKKSNARDKTPSPKRSPSQNARQGNSIHPQGRNSNHIKTHPNHSKSEKTTMADGTRLGIESEMDDLETSAKTSVDGKGRRPLLALNIANSNLKQPNSAGPFGNDKTSLNPYFETSQGPTIRGPLSAHPLRNYGNEAPPSPISFVLNENQGQSSTSSNAGTRSRTVSLSLRTDLFDQDGKYPGLIGSLSANPFSKNANDPWNKPTLSTSVGLNSPLSAVDPKSTNLLRPGNNPNPYYSQWGNSNFATTSTHSAVNSGVLSSSAPALSLFEANFNSRQSMQGPTGAITKMFFHSLF
jgi:hypothetical protein